MTITKADREVAMREVRAEAVSSLRFMAKVENKRGQALRADAFATLADAIERGEDRT